MLIRRVLKIYSEAVQATSKDFLAFLSFSVEVEMSTCLNFPHYIALFALCQHFFRTIFHIFPHSQLIYHVYNIWYKNKTLYLVYYHPINTRYSVFSPSLPPPYIIYVNLGSFFSFCRCLFPNFRPRHKVKYQSKYHSIYINEL